MNRQTQIQTEKEDSKKTKQEIPDEKETLCISGLVFADAVAELFGPSFREEKNKLKKIPRR